MRRQLVRAAALGLVVTLVASCSAGVDDSAEPKQAGTTLSTTVGSDAAGGLGPDDGHGPNDADEVAPVGDVRTHEAPWAETASSIRDGEEQFTRVQCPADGEGHTVWGTDTYTDDSSVCTAAVHAGLFGYDDGGEVLIEHRPGLGSYRGTSRNGVSSRDWDSWPGTFVFINAGGVAVEGD